MAAREALVDPRPRGRLRGSLVEAEEGTPIEGVHIVLLATANNEVAETLRTGLDGEFVSERLFPGGTVRAWVRDPKDNALLGQHEAAFDPTAAGPWRVPVSLGMPTPLAKLESQEVALSGWIEDAEAHRVEGAFVRVIPLRTSDGVGRAESSSNGEFRVTQLRQGPHRLVVHGRFASSAAIVVDLVQGWNEVGRVRLPLASGGGSVSGCLIDEEGPEEPFGVLFLRERGSGKELVFPRTAEPSRSLRSQTMPCPFSDTCTSSTSPFRTVAWTGSLTSKTPPSTESTSTRCPSSKSPAWMSTPASRPRSPPISTESTFRPCSTNAT